MGKIAVAGVLVQFLCSSALAAKAREPLEVLGWTGDGRYFAWIENRSEQEGAFRWTARVAAVADAVTGETRWYRLNLASRDETSLELARARYADWSSSIHFAAWKRRHVLTYTLDPRDSAGRLEAVVRVRGNAAVADSLDGFRYAVLAPSAKKVLEEGTILTSWSPGDRGVAWIVRRGGGCVVVVSALGGTVALVESRDAALTGEVHPTARPPSSPPATHSAEVDVLSGA